MTAMRACDEDQEVREKREMARNPIPQTTGDQKSAPRRSQSFPAFRVIYQIVSATLRQAIFGISTRHFPNPTLDPHTRIHAPPARYEIS